jgi:hypothetical protein
MTSGDQQELSSEPGSLIPAVQEILRNLQAENRKEDQS